MNTEWSTIWIAVMITLCLVAGSTSRKIMIEFDEDSIYKAFRAVLRALDDHKEKVEEDRRRRQAISGQRRSSCPPSKPH